ncbi:hypothetical protein GOODEAATRI_030946 [Goodea atripinnis]|uniref:Uncharacterized protein n=1 Tax=Goodea atripinnis TaxID=208336 RepID=A0ABV0NPH4_9TELE
MKTFGWQHMLLQNLYLPFSINGAFTDVQVTHAMGTNTPLYHHICCLLNFALKMILILNVFSSFSPLATAFGLSFKCRDFYRFPDSLMILWTIADKIPKFFANVG